MAPPAEKASSGCSKWDGGDITSLLEKEEFLEEIVWKGLKMWHLIFLSIAAALGVIILLCCCVKFRIPRTKQEIEADYIRRKILRKFRKRLKAIQNQELDEMDLKKALDKIRAEFKSDTESLAQSEAGFSAATISSTGLPGVGGVPGSTYRRASQIQIDISLEEIRAHSLGLRARVVLGLSRLFGRSRVSQSDKVALTVAADGQTQLTVPEGALTAKKSSADKKSTGDKKKDEKSGKAGEKVASSPNPTAVAPGQSTSVKGGGTAQASSVVKGQEKKQKEIEEKERKKLEKEKEKAEKDKLKIENEKAKKSKEKVEKPPKPEKPDKSKAKPVETKDKPKDAEDKFKDKTDKAKKVEVKKTKDKPEKPKKPEKLKEKPEKSNPPQK